MSNNRSVELDIGSVSADLSQKSAVTIERALGDYLNRGGPPEGGVRMVILFVGSGENDAALCGSSSEDVYLGSYL